MIICPAVKWQNRYGYFDKNGEKVIDFLYGGAKNFHEGLAVVSSGNFAGVEDDKYWFVGAGLTTSYKNNQFGVIDRWGNEVLPEEYLCISDFEDGTAICQRNRDKKVGIIQAPAVQDSTSSPFTVAAVLSVGNCIVISSVVMIAALAVLSHRTSAFRASAIVRSGTMVRPFLRTKRGADFSLQV